MMATKASDNIHLATLIKPMATSSPVMDSVSVAFPTAVSTAATPASAAASAASNAIPLGSKNPNVSASKAATFAAAAASKPEFFQVYVQLISGVTSDTITRAAYMKHGSCIYAVVTRLTDVELFITSRKVAEEMDDNGLEVNGQRCACTMLGRNKKARFYLYNIHPFSNDEDIRKSIQALGIAVHNVRVFRVPGTTVRTSRGEVYVQGKDGSLSLEAANELKGSMFGQPLYLRKHQEKQAQVENIAKNEVQPVSASSSSSGSSSRERSSKRKSRAKKESTKVVSSIVDDLVSAVDLNMVNASSAAVETSVPTTSAEEHGEPSQLVPAKSLVPSQNADAEEEEEEWKVVGKKGSGSRSPSSSPILTLSPPSKVTGTLTSEDSTAARTSYVPQKAPSRKGKAPAVVGFKRLIPQKQRVLNLR